MSYLSPTGDFLFSCSSINKHILHKITKYFLDGIYPIKEIRKKSSSNNIKKQESFSDISLKAKEFTKTKHIVFFFQKT